MSERLTLDDLSLLAESVELECKAAQGRHGQGELPADFWPTYSAMANTDGGVILLGIQEKPRGAFQAAGLARFEQVRKALWDNLHNPKQVSASLLTEQQIQPVTVGYGDHAGSGIPKIYRNWEGQHWRRPLLYELPDPEQTLMELRMTSLVPAETLAELEAHLGPQFAALPELARLALVTAVAEGMVNHARLREISTDHPADITKMLAHLVKDGLLVSEGTGRGMVYFAPWQSHSGAAIFAGEQAGRSEPEGDNCEPLTPELGDLTGELSALTGELGALTGELGGGGIATMPIISSLNQLLPVELDTLAAIAQPVRHRRRAVPAAMEQVLLALCKDCYLGLRVIAELLERRDSKHLRDKVLNPMVKQGLLYHAYPRPNDPRQAYTSSAVAVPVASE